VEASAGAGEVLEVFDVVEVDGEEEKQLCWKTEERAGLGRGYSGYSHDDTQYATGSKQTVRSTNPSDHRWGFLLTSVVRYCMHSCAKARSDVSTAREDD